jgi:hypothetical protein
LFLVEVFMKIVEIVMTAADPDGTRAWAEVKALDEPGMPTIAHVEARKTWNDTFQARPGRHVYQFRVDRPSKIKLACKVDGVGVGQTTEFDCTAITAGRRYTFEVPS